LAGEQLVGRVPDSWEYTTLGTACARGGGDIQTGPFGSQLHASDYVLAGIPSIMPQNIGDNRIVEDGIARIAPSDAARLSRYLVREGDIVYSRRGDVERRALVREREDGWLCGTGCLRVRLGQRGVDPRYASFYFGHPSVREWVVRHAHGATMPNLNTSILAACPFVVPPKNEQHAIAHILGTLDDKIELNRRMNETLEAMARALFQWWLMDVSPTRAKATDLIRDGILEIGDGYRAKNSELGEPGLPFIRAANLNNGFDTDAADRLRQDRVIRAGKKIARRGDVAFTSKGTIGRFAWVAADDKFVYSPQVCYWRSLDHDRLHPTILYCWMQTGDLMGQIDAVAGQTDMAPYVSLQDQRAMSIPVFPPSQHAIVRKLDPLLARQSANVVESRILAELRDTLLPKLVSGQIRIKDAERIAGGIA
jgi:type I restriction enzyme, S subunit